MNFSKDKMKDLKIRGIVGASVFSLAAICFSISAIKGGGYSLAFVWVYLDVAVCLYLYTAHQYMVRNGLADAKKVSREHERELNRIFWDSLRWLLKL